MNVHIRSYQPSDLPALQRITVEAFDGVSIDRNIEQQFGEINGHDWRFRKARHIEEDVQRQSDGVFVVEVDGAIAGYITTFLDLDTGIGMIPNLAVDQQYRGQGLGRMLIEHALDHFRSRGATHARIETLEQNPIGRSLYPSLGFQQVARQIHYCMKLDEEGRGER